MAKKPFTVEHPEALTAQLRALGSAASESTLRKAAATGATIFLNEMQARIPVDSGDGRAALVVAYDSEVSVPGAIASYIVTWLKSAYYLIFVEYGTSRSAADPFMRPSYDAKKREVGQAVADAIDAQIRAAINGK